MSWFDLFVGTLPYLISMLIRSFEFVIWWMSFLWLLFLIVGCFWCCCAIIQVVKAFGLLCAAKKVIIVEMFWRQSVKESFCEMLILDVKCCMRRLQQSFSSASGRQKEAHWHGATLKLLFCCCCLWSFGDSTQSVHKCLDQRFSGYEYSLGSAGIDTLGCAGQKTRSLQLVNTVVALTRGQMLLLAWLTLGTESVNIISVIAMIREQNRCQSRVE